MMNDDKEINRYDDISCQYSGVYMRFNHFKQT